MATVIDNPRAIDQYRRLALLHALRLEVKGMRKRGQSAYSIIKMEFGLTGSKAKVLADFEKMMG